jgi:hypothetical protein
LVEQWAQWIARRGWTVPAVLLLEIARPFSFIASQGLLLCQPLAGLLNVDRPVAQASDLLANRSNLDHLLACLERAAGDQP